MASLPDWYSADDAAEVAGLSRARIEAISRRMGYPMGSLPAGIALKLRTLTGAVVDAVIRQAVLDLPAEPGRRATAWQ